MFLHEITSKMLSIRLTLPSNNNAYHNDNNPNPTPIIRTTQDNASVLVSHRKVKISNR